MTYLTDHVSTPTPQTEPMDDRQVRNSAGGYVYGADHWARLERFLILGSEGGSFYAGERDLTKENVDAVKRCLEENWPRAVSVAADVSLNNRAPKNDPAILVLALASTYLKGSDGRGDYLSAAVGEVCRTGSHILMFVSFADKLRGWGRGLRRIVAAWYESRTPDELAYQVVKYRNRYGWTHHDVLHQCHAVVHPTIAEYVKSGTFRQTARLGDPDVAYIYDAVFVHEKGHDALAAVRAGLPREALPTEYLTSPAVWDALLDKMPMTAMIRNLATMTRVGLLVPRSDAAATVVERLADSDYLRKSRVHPIQVLSALLTYRAGHGSRDASKTWTPIPDVVNALDDAFYGSFGNLEVSDKTVMTALDVSASMTWSTIAGVPGLTPRVASAALAMVSAAQFANSDCFAFTSNGTMTHLDVSPRRRLDDVLHEVNRLTAGGTDCSIPMRFASLNNLGYDAFHVFTDSETWSGPVHVSAALRDYRRRVPGAKLAVVAMVSNGFSIADPADPGMLDVVGFDTSTPNALAAFTNL